MPATDFLTKMAANGQYHFTTDDLQLALRSSPEATRAVLRRFKNKNLIATPYRGFHVIVPPEYQHLGCLPPDQFIPQLMAFLDQPYYAGILSASRYHGAAHHQPQVFQVIAPCHRPGISCGQVRVHFIARKNITKIPFMTFNTPRGHVQVSTPEATAFDLVGYHQHAGGIDNVASLLIELNDALNPKTLAEIAPFSPLPWAQRLGYLLDHFSTESRTELLAAYVKARAKETTELIPARNAAGATRNARWKIKVNTIVEPDL